jgi:hypothetical protein
MAEAFDESGHIGITHFPYDEIDKADIPETKDIDAAVRAFELLLAWVWQHGPKNNNGIEIRAVICCWIFMKQLRPITLTEMAATVGRDKQSLGRWFDEFKKDFPQIKTCHMKNS